MILSASVPNWPTLTDSAADAEPEELVARVEQIFHRHLDAVWRTARDLGVLPRDLEDVAQEVMVVCVRRLSDIDPERERAFLLATTARIAANWRRARRRRPTESVESMEGLSIDAGAPQLRRDGPAELLEHKRELQVVQAALEQMTEPQRIAFTLFEIEGLTAREIAHELGLSEPVVFARIQRARGVFHRYVERVRGPGHGGRSA